MTLTVFICGKLLVNYPRALGNRGNLSIDLNFMFRVTLWPIVKKDSYHLNPFIARNIPTLDIHELAAGKLAALLARCASRDLYDAYHLFTSHSFDITKLCIAFVVYGGIDRKDWRTISKNDVKFDLNDLNAKLLPVMQRNAFDGIKSHKDWASEIVTICQKNLNQNQCGRDVCVPSRKGE